MIFSCAAPPTGQGLSNRLKVGTLNTLAAQRLALYYNIQLISGYAAQTIRVLSVVTTVLMQADLLIQYCVETSLGGTTTQAQASVMNSLLAARP